MIKELDLNHRHIIKKINDFLEKNKFSDYMQEVYWNYIRNEKNKYYLYYEDIQGNIKWVCNILDKSSESGRVLYAPRGPVLDYSSKQDIKLFFENIERWMHEKKYNKLIINPIINEKIIDNFPKDLHYRFVDPHDYEALMESSKLAIMNIIFDEDKLIEKLPSKFRQNIRRSYRKGLTSRVSREVDLYNFYKLYIDTSVRHKFRPHDLEYFKKICKTYASKLVFFEVWYEDKPLAMSIDIPYKDTLIYLYGVSSSKNRNLLGMYNLQWETIKYCIKNKIPKYDFGGVFCDENELDNKDYGLYTFKKGFCYNGFKDVCPDIIIEFDKGGKND